MFFSSCAVPEPAPPSLPDVASDGAVQKPPSPPVAETQLPQVSEGTDNVSVGKTVPEIIYPFMGSGDAPLTVIEYGDFSDRVSSFAASSQVAAIKRDFVVSNKVKLVFKPYPLSGSEDSKLASRAAWCMWEQGSVQFWAYQQTMFTFYYHLSRDSLNNYASRIPNLDKPVFTACLDSGRYSETVEATLMEGGQLGIEKAPAFVIGDNVLADDVPYKALKAAIDEELGSGEGNVITGNAVVSVKSIYGVKEWLAEFLKRFFL